MAGLDTGKMLAYWLAARHTWEHSSSRVDSGHICLIQWRPGSRPIGSSRWLQLGFHGHSTQTHAMPCYGAHQAREHCKGLEPDTGLK